ncbi:MAG: DNA translocase FtsK [Chloroflexota bacterium]
MKDSYPNWWSELQDSVSKEMVGLLAFLIGGFFLLTLLNSEDSWLERYTGWTAPWFALAIILFGAVLMLSRRAGYWSLEAIIGGQLLLLSLMTNTFILQNQAPDWVPSFEGENGGLVGWTFGNLLVSSFGRWPAFALMLMAGVIGTIMLFRYTPLVYLIGLGQGQWPSVRQRATQGLQAAQRLVGNVFFRRDEQYYEGADYENLNRQDDVDIWEPGERAENRYGNPYGSNGSTVDIYENEVDSQATHEDLHGGHYGSAADPYDVNGQAATGPNSRVVDQSRSDRPTPSERAPTNNRPANPLNRPKASSTPKPIRKSGELPDMDILISDSGHYVNEQEQALAQRIEDTLEDFNVPVRVVHIESGPTVTQFGVEPLYLERAGQRRRIRVNSIVKLADDLALALEAPSVRIEAPVPGKPYVGIEVPNIDKVMVNLRGLIEAKQWRKEAGTLGLGLGRDTAGKPVIIDLAKAPHMLIAGATGAGKSVCINTIIISLLMRHGPESLRFVLVDPKMVELPGYNGIPHLLGKVIIDADQVMGMLTWLLLEMDDRYRLFKDVGVRNIDTYNSQARKNRKKDAPKPLPYIVMIIDELADLMMTAADDIERQICRLAQMARATGIHLILATQRPSTDVVTGLIKANFPTRIAFAVSSQIDSRVIMDTPGAERLLGRGDMLLMRSDTAKLKRVQGCYVSDDEINSVAKWWKDERAAKAEAAGETILPVVPPWNSIMDKLDEDEELILDAIDLLRDLESASTSFMQRKLEIGYPKAARLMEELEQRKVVGPDQGGGRGRKVLLKKEDGDDEDGLGDDLAEEETVNAR